MWELEKMCGNYIQKVPRNSNWIENTLHVLWRWYPKLSLVVELLIRQVLGQFFTNLVFCARAHVISYNSNFHCERFVWHKYTRARFPESWVSMHVLRKSALKIRTNKCEYWITTLLIFRSLRHVQRTEPIVPESSFAEIL